MRSPCRPSGGTEEPGHPVPYRGGAEVQGEALVPAWGAARGDALPPGLPAAAPDLRRPRRRPVGAAGRLGGAAPAGRRVRRGPLRRLGRPQAGEGVHAVLPPPARRHARGILGLQHGGRVPGRRTGCASTRCCLWSTRGTGGRRPASPRRWRAPPSGGTEWRARS
ncbi:hypothetical protein ANANG_G00190390 [Anguilla anguilla]|uniref:Uncharacterized protein n=1 Tax=Anguilla anguilla TaxID=7936 RepID=A0A9D3M2Q8_ANGAN|nr:hypothetical protein ANANG_G00190390 [Anguilla anguilla]